MTVKQIYSLLNVIKQTNFKHLNAHPVFDLTDFISFGNDVLSSSTNKETFYNALVDRIGKTIFAIREYQKADRNITVDEFTFGNILQKVSYKLQSAENNSNWDRTPTNPYTLTPKGGIVQNLFVQKLPTWCYEDVILDNQLESAFISPTAMSGFINGLYTRMSNALECDLEILDNETVASLVVEIAEDNTIYEEWNTQVRARNLWAEWLTKNPSTTLTLDNCLENREFLEFVCIEMGTVIPFIERMNAVYNDGTVERFTKREDLIVEVNSRFEQMYNVYLKSNTYHDELVKLPNFKSIPYWNTTGTPMTVYGKSSQGNSLTIPNVLCIMRDKDACVNTLERKKLVNKYDEFNARTYAKLSCDARYCVDISENALFFYLAEPTEVVES